MPIPDVTHRLPLKGVGNRPIRAYGRIICQIEFKNEINEIELIIIPDAAICFPLILGRDFLAAFNIKLCKVKRNTVDILRNKNNPNITRTSSDLSVLARLPLINFDFNSPVTSDLEKPDTAKVSSLSHTVNESVDGFDIHKYTEYIRSVANEYACPVFAYEEITPPEGSAIPNAPQLEINSNLDVVSRERLTEIIRRNYLEPDDIVTVPHPYEMNIRLTDDTPIHAVPRRLSYYERNEVQNTIDRLLDKNIIRPSQSPYASAIVLVKKKSGEIRMCVDYRALNKVTARDNFPLPLIEDCVGYLGGKRFFTTLDLRDGFFHVAVAPSSTKYTSFVVPQGQYEYLKMPFGLKNAPAVFQRFVSEIFHDLIAAGKIQVYIDDIIIATETLDEHFALLETVLRRITEKNLELKLSKCRFAHERIDYLGYTVNALGLRPNDNHISAITDLRLPTNAKELQRNIGLFSYFRMFIKSFSTIAKPLRALLQQNTEFKFDENCRSAFNTLRDKLIEGPILAIYDPRKETELHCDASALGYGAALMQRQTDRKFHPVAYFSQASTPAESRYHSFELETMAIIYALRRFRVYLEGVKFRIVTDCNSLKLTLEKKHMNPRIARWALELQSYDYEIVHRSGINMGHVDALSRCHEATPAIENTVNAVDMIADDETPFTDAACRLVAATDADDVSFRIQMTQYRDEAIAELRNQLETRAVPGYEMINGLVFKTDDTAQPRLYVPMEMEGNVIRSMHEKIVHLGPEKTSDMIKRHYWFPNIKSKVDDFIKNCIKCIMYAAPVRVSARNLYSIKKNPIPFDTVHLDHFGPLPSINSKRKHLLVVVDGFTKHCKLYPVNSTSTREVIASLKKYFEYYSRPRRVITDQGTCFTGLEFTNQLKEWNVEHVKIAVASPQANGQVERVNRTIKAMMGKATESMNHADWVQQLGHIEYAINNAKHSTTGFSPSEMLFGVTQKGIVPDELTEYVQNEYQSTGERDLHEIRTQAEAAIEKSQQYAENRHAEHSTEPRKYEVGDFVVMRNVDVTAGVNKKLIPTHRGPYAIHKVLPHDRYVIRDIENCQLTQRPYDNVIEAARLRKWVDKKLACA